MVFFLRFRFNVELNVVIFCIFFTLIFNIIGSGFIRIFCCCCSLHTKVHILARAPTHTLMLFLLLLDDVSLFFFGCDVTNCSQRHGGPCRTRRVWVCAFQLSRCVDTEAEHALIWWSVLCLLWRPPPQVFKGRGAVSCCYGCSIILRVGIFCLFIKN